MKIFRARIGYPIRADHSVAGKRQDAFPGPWNDPVTTHFRLGYRPWLDGLRGLAILLVLAGHLQLLWGGFLGVDIFFVLSGFLITTILAEEWQRRQSISLKAFYVRRGLRLFPAFLTLLFILSFPVLWIQSADDAPARRAEVIVAGCYVTNWTSLHRTPMPTLGHTWSLSVEEQFYLLWPVLLYGGLRVKLPRRQILLLVCAGIVVSSLHRMKLYNGYRGPNSAIDIADVCRLYAGLDTRADTLLVGCLLGLLVSWDMLPRTQRFVFWLGPASLVCFGSLCYLFYHGYWHHPAFYRRGLFTAVAIMVGGIMLRLLSRPTGLSCRMLEFAPLVGIGRISYGMYLFHFPIMHWLQPARFGWRFPAMTLLAVGLTAVAALLSYYCIERPCLRLKERLRLRASTLPANAMCSLETVDRGESRSRAAA
jgi:peptidoglycan/LPS O-acetylase OafA/YrhL